MRPDSPSPVIPFLVACAGIATFSAMDVLMKGLSIDIGAYNAVLWRTGAGTLFSGLLYLASRPAAWPDAATMKIHAVRALFVAGMAITFFWALARLPMAEAIALAFVAPLMTLYMAAIFLGEKIGPRSIAASMLGLVGVVVIAWPELTLLSSGSAMGEDEVIGVMAALAGACTSAVAAILVRNLVHSERTATIVLWFSLMASMLSLLSIPFGWKALSLQQYGALIASGFCGGLGQILMTSAYRHAEVSVVAPFEYVSMVLAIVVGYFAFGDVPTPYMLVGGVIVVGAGLFIIWREHRLGLERASARKIAVQG